MYWDRDETALLACFCNSDNQKTSEQKRIIGHLIAKISLLSMLWVSLTVWLFYIDIGI